MSSIRIQDSIYLHHKLWIIAHWKQKMQIKEKVNFEFNRNHEHYEWCAYLYIQRIVYTQCTAYTHFIMWLHCVIIDLFIYYYYFLNSLVGQDVEQTLCIIFKISHRNTVLSIHSPAHRLLCMKVFLLILNFFSKLECYKASPFRRLVYWPHYS